MSKTNFLALFPIAKAGSLVNNLNDEQKNSIDFDWHKDEFKTNIMQIQMKFGR